MPIKEITSSSNPLIKEVKLLKNRRARKKSGQTIVEGFKENNMLLKAGRHHINYLFICPDYFTKDKDINKEFEYLIDLFTKKSISIISVNSKIFSDLSFRENPDGILSVIEFKKYDLEEVEKNKKTFFLLVEAFEKPGNLGAILRTADGVGVDAIFLCDSVSDFTNPNVIRASLGAIFTVPIIEISKEEAILFFEKNGVDTFATSPYAKSVYWDCDFKKPCALIMGSEKDGISEYMKDRAKHTISIPMKGKVDSLNLSAATSLLSYEVLRQRSGL